MQGGLVYDPEYVECKRGLELKSLIRPRGDDRVVNRASIAVSHLTAMVAPRNVIRRTASRSLGFLHAGNAQSIGLSGDFKFA
jgi:hypothetical protein